MPAGEQTGLYNVIVANDIDDDGDIDIIAGNQGLNNQFITSAAEPMEMHYADFDGNGTAEPVISYYIDHKQWPIYSRDDLMQQIPSFNKRFLYFSDYAKADMTGIFGDQLKAALHYSASNMSSILLENTGKSFAVQHLPVQVQWYPIYSISVADVNDDGKKDLIIGGNQTYSRIKFGAYECGKGDVLVNKDDLRFDRLTPLNAGIRINGDVRNIIVIGKQVIFGINNKQPLLYTFQK